MDKQIRRNARNAQAPILLLLAGRDEIIDNEKRSASWETNSPKLKMTH